MKKTVFILLLCLGLTGAGWGFVFSLSSEPVKGFIYYFTTANWSSQSVADDDVVSVLSNATVTLDRDDAVRILRIGNAQASGALVVDAPYNLTVTDSIENDGIITVDGGTLSNGVAGVVQGSWFTDRFAADDQSAWATDDAQIQEQIGPKWKRGNPTDLETQYRINNNKLTFGAVSSSQDQKATLVNTAARTLNDGTGTGFRLSAVVQQNHTASTGFMGLVFNYQDGGSYYLLRVSGVGTVQFLVYSNLVKQPGTVLNVSEAFTPVQNRPYLITVESAGLYAFNISIVDTVSGATVYSIGDLTVGGSFLKLQDGIGGIYATSALAAVDTFEVDTAPDTVRYTCMDCFTDANQTSWASNDLQVALQIGSKWKRINPLDQETKYRISNNKLDVGAVSSSSVQKASLINTAVETRNDGAGTNFTLSAEFQQDTSASSAFMGLVFNCQDDGSYYVFRISGIGTVQFLVYSNYVKQMGTVLNQSEAFTPVQNRTYALTVASAEPQVFDISVEDTVSGSIVYSTNDLVVGGAFARLRDGWPGFFVTHGLFAMDNFYVDAVPKDTGCVLSGNGETHLKSGGVSINGGTVSRAALNGAMFKVRGGVVSLGRVSVGESGTSVFKVIGNSASINLYSLDQSPGSAASGRFRFVFNETGVSPVNVQSWMRLDAARLFVDGSSYTNGPDRFTLFDSACLLTPFADSAISVSGFSAPYIATVEQDDSRVDLVYKAPDSFEDVTVEAGLESMDNINWACWFDFNHDEWLDLAAGHRVWINNSGTNFTMSSWVGNVVAADFDNDGWTDLFSHSQRRLFRNNGGTLVEDIALPSFPDPYSSQAASCGDYNGDGWVDIYITGYENGSGAAYSDYLLMNNSGTSFSKSAMSPVYNARGVTSCDFDQDNDLDIYVSNYRLLPNLLWQNNGSGSFADVASTYNTLGGSGHSIGSCWGDFNNDGLFDLFAGNFSHSGQPQSRFLRNRGAGNSYYFQNKGTCGVYWQESYASPAAGDFDNDGRLDLFFTTVYAIASGGIPNYPVLFRNTNDFAFAEFADPPLTELPATYQAAWGDYNNDGFLDLMTAGKLFRNTAWNGHSWLKVKLSGDGNAVNRSAIGAQVRITLGSETLTRQVEAGTGQGNQNDPTLHFGLGQQTDPVDVDILWPDGTTQTVTDVTTNQLIEVVYGE